MTRWETGASDILAMIASGDLELVTPSSTNAERLLVEAHRHLRSANALAEDDPSGAYDLLYSAARKSLAAVLAAQGLRATSRGGHIAVQAAIGHQLGRSSSVIKPFGRLRRTRNEADYPRLDSPAVTSSDTAEDVIKAQAIVEAMQKLLPHVGSWG